tara:strand:+ start:129 stop:467 length:339 start_codon:yes stop_codon:yes gene_type:complete
MEGDIVQMGAYVGAGLACTGMGGAAIGVGHVVGNYISGALRNPSAAAGQTATMFIGIAFAEALGIFSFLVALLLNVCRIKFYFLRLVAFTSTGLKEVAGEFVNGCKHRTGCK